MPAFVRRYPFVHDGAGPRPSQVLIDAACAGFEQADGEVQRTQVLCARIVQLGLLKPEQIDVTLPDGKTLSAGGVQMIDEGKLKALPVPTDVELLRNRTLGLLHAQLISTTNLQRLTDRLAQRVEAAPAARVRGG